MHDMDLVLKQEEIVWFQKFRTKWIQDGDCTKYYHLKAINRKKRNKILMLRDIQGKWIDVKSKKWKIKKKKKRRNQKRHSPVFRLTRSSR